MYRCILTSSQPERDSSRAQTGSRKCLWTCDGAVALGITLTHTHGLPLTKQWTILTIFLVSQKRIVPGPEAFPYFSDLFLRPFRIYSGDDPRSGLDLDRLRMYLLVFMAYTVPHIHLADPVYPRSHCWHWDKSGSFCIAECSSAIFSITGIKNTVVKWVYMQGTSSQIMHSNFGGLLIHAVYSVCLIFIEIQELAFIYSTPSRKSIWCFSPAATVLNKTDCF